jgi:hypothetical protein
LSTGHGSKHLKGKYLQILIRLILVK